MAGLYDRLANREDPALDPIPVHMVKAVLTVVAAGDFTAQQARDGLNAVLAVDLRASDLTDFNALLTQLNAASGTANKLLYLERCWSACYLVEVGGLGETAWRNACGIA